MPEGTRAKAPAWLSALNRGDLAAYEALCSPALVLHFADPLLKVSAPGLKGWMQVLGILRAGFPNLKLQLQNEARQGHTRMYTWIAKGTHRGPFLRIRATGHQVAFAGRFVMRSTEGELCELWVRMNLLPILAQLGMAPQVEA